MQILRKICKSLKNNYFQSKRVIHMAKRISIWTSPEGWLTYWQLLSYIVVISLLLIGYACIPAGTYLKYFSIKTFLFITVRTFSSRTKPTTHPPLYPYVFKKCIPPLVQQRQYYSYINLYLVQGLGCDYIVILLFASDQPYIYRWTLLAWWRL